MSQWEFSNLWTTKTTTKKGEKQKEVQMYNKEVDSGHNS